MAAAEENARLRAQVQALLDEKQKLVSGLKTKLAHLISQKNQFAQKAQDLERTNAMLEQQVASSSASPSAAAAVPDGTDSSTPEQLRARIAQLENEQSIIHEKIKAKLQALVSEKYELTMKEHALLQNQIDPADLQRLRNQLTLLLNEKTVLTQKHYEQSSALQNAQMWQKQNNQLRQTIEKVEAENKSTYNKVTELQETINANTAEKNSLTARLDELKAKNAEYEKKLQDERASQHNSALWQVQNDALQNQARVLQNEVSVLEAKLADASRTAEEKASSAGMEQTILEQQKEEYESATADLRTMIDQTLKDEEECKATLESMNTELGNLVAEKQGMVMRIRWLQRNGEEKAKRNDKVRKKMLDIEEETNAGMLQVEELSAKLLHVEEQDKLNDDLRFELQDELDRNTELYNRIEQLTGETQESDGGSDLDNITNAILNDDGSSNEEGSKRRTARQRTLGRHSIVLSEKKKKGSASTLREASENLTRATSVGDLINKAKTEAEREVDEMRRDNRQSEEDGEDTREIKFVQTDDASSSNKYPQIRAATLEKLVERLTYEKFPDMEYVQSFMLTYRSFTTPLDLLELVIARYCIVPPPGCTPEELNEFKQKKQVPIRLRVFNVLKSWISEHTYDFENDEQLRSTMEFFINSTMPQTGMERAAKTLNRTLERNLSDAKKDTELIDARVRALSDKERIKSFKDVDTRSLAVVISLQEQEMYRRIQPKECFGLAWSKKDKEESSPNILAFVRRFNDMSAWVQYEVMKGAAVGKHSDRGRILRKMIRLANDLLEMNNFNGAMEILAGLGASSIYRLKNAWGKVDKSSKQKLEELRETLANAQNYKKLRNALHMANPPCIPYFGMYLTDLTFIEDGNSDEVEGLINFNKRRLYATVLREIQQYQQMQYTDTEDPATHEYLARTLAAALEEFPGENEAYSYSLVVEPRGSN